MKRIITLVVLVLAMLVTAGTAQADPGAAMNCGTSNVLNEAKPLKLTHDGNPNTWHVDISVGCGGKNWLLELQRSTDGGLHWVDMPEVYTFGSPVTHFTSSVPAGTYNNYLGGIGGTSGDGCHVGYDYRATIWNVNDDRWTQSLSGGC